MTQNATAAAASAEAPEESVALEIVSRVKGRVVLAQPGVVYVGRGYAIHKSSDGGHSWQAVTSLPRSLFRRAVEQSRLASRLLRHEVRALARHPDGHLIAANREGVFVGREGDAEMRATRLEVGDSPLLPPMRITIGPEGEVVWGEYTGKLHDWRIRIYYSLDGGRTHEIAHTFGPGEIEHVHNVVWDEERGFYWVLLGDLGNKPGIGKLSADFSRFEWFVKGEQRHRAVEVFDFGDKLVYVNDTQLETNSLYSFDKETGETERHRDFDGSCIYGCRFGGLYAVSTSVEPSDVNHSPWATLWLSRDGYQWKRAFRRKKDHWSAKYLQFGSIVLPSGATDSELIYFSGQAVEDIDGETVIARLADGEEL